jgi:hypothetical protein
VNSLSFKRHGFEPDVIRHAALQARWATSEVTKLRPAKVTMATKTGASLPRFAAVRSFERELESSMRTWQRCALRIFRNPARGDLLDIMHSYVHMNA